MFRPEVVSSHSIWRRVDPFHLSPLYANESGLPTLPGIVQISRWTLHPALEWEGLEIFRLRYRRCWGGDSANRLDKPMASQKQIGPSAEALQMSRIPPALTMLPAVLMRSNEFGDAPAQMMALSIKKGGNQPTMAVATSQPSCPQLPSIRPAFFLN